MAKQNTADSVEAASFSFTVDTTSSKSISSELQIKQVGFFCNIWETLTGYETDFAYNSDFRNRRGAEA
jgi:hypothetical protein